MSSSDPIPRGTRRVLVALLAIVVTCGAVSIIVNLTVGESNETVRRTTVVDEAVDELGMDVDQANIMVSTSEDNRVSLTYTAWYSENEPQVRNEVTGTSLTIWSGGCDGCFVEFDLRVPEQVSLDLRVGGGEVTVDGGAGGATVTTGWGPIEVFDATGDIEAHSGSGEVMVRDVTAAVTATAASGDVKVEEVTGDVDVTAPDGEVELIGITGDLTVESGTGSVRGERLDSKNAHVTSDDDGVFLEFDTAPDDINVQAESGQIDLAVPAIESPYLVDATAGEGTPDVRIATSPSSLHLITATIGDGILTIRYR